MMKRFIFLLSLLFSFSVLTGIARAETLKETFKKIILVDGQERLELRNQNGNIQIRAWDRDEVEIVAYKKVKSGSPNSARRYMNEVKIEIDDAGEAIRVHTRFPDDDEQGGGIFSWLLNLGGKNASVDYEVMVPAEFDLDVNSTNGHIDIRDCQGRFALATTNGNMEADNIKGLARCKTTNGSITMTFLEVNGDDEMSFRSTNGSVKLYLPESLNAMLQARTTNGNIRCDLPMHDVNKDSDRKLEAVINDGGPVIYIKTTNGTIRIYES